MYDSVDSFVITQKMKIWAVLRLIIFFVAPFGILVLIVVLELELPSLVYVVSFVVWLVAVMFVFYFTYKTFRPTRCDNCRKSIGHGEYCKSCRVDRVSRLRESTDRCTCQVCKEIFSNYNAFENHFKIKHGEPYSFTSALNADQTSIDIYPDEGFMKTDISKDFSS